MPLAPAPELHLRPTARLQQMQRLMMAPKIQQSLAILQMPRQELEVALAAELEQNPLLELLPAEREQEIEEEPLLCESEKESQVAEEEAEIDFSNEDFRALQYIDEAFQNHFEQSDNFYTHRTRKEEQVKNFLESNIRQEISLGDHLLQQVRERLLPEKEQAAAELLLGYLDDNGLLTTPLQEIALWHGHDLPSLTRAVKIVKMLDPPGIGAKDLRDCLLIQLWRQGKMKSLGYLIVKKHYNDLLHNRIPKIAHGLATSTQAVERAIESTLSPLYLHPGQGYGKHVAPTVAPDITIHEEAGQLQILVHDESSFSLRFNSRYIKMLNGAEMSAETQSFFKEKIASARGLLHNIHQRNLTLEKVGTYLLQRHYSFFTSPTGALVPLTMQQVADELGVHESTIARAVANKYLFCPRGLYPLRFFFSVAYTTEKGEDISSTTVQGKLQALICSEDKSSPFTDGQLSHQLKNQGIICARRTVAKYRIKLKIGTAQQRRKFA